MMAQLHSAGGREIQSDTITDGGGAAEDSGKEPSDNNELGFYN